MNNSSVPSDEAFRKASAAARERNRGLSDLCSMLLNQFRGKGLHEVFIQYSRYKNTFVVHLFMRTNKDVACVHVDGFSGQITEAIYKGLEDAGRGSRKELNVSINFDSHENVLNSSAGDYYDYMQ